VKVNNIVKIAVAVFVGVLVCLITMSPVLHADDTVTGESSAVIDISATATTQVYVTAGDGSRLDVEAQGAADAHFHFAADADTVFDIYITGDGESHIDVSGPCEVNVRVEGSSEVNIDIDDEVKLNVEASDDAQVVVNQGNSSNPGNPGEPPNSGNSTSNSEGSNLNVEASDAAQVVVDDQNLNEPLELDEQTSKLNSFLPIIAGIFLVIGLPAFFLIRRKVQKD